MHELCAVIFRQFRRAISFPCSSGMQRSLKHYNRKIVEVICWPVKVSIAVVFFHYCIPGLILDLSLWYGYGRQAMFSRDSDTCTGFLDQYRPHIFRGTKRRCVSTSYVPWCDQHVSASARTHAHTHTRIHYRKKK